MDTVTLLLIAVPLPACLVTMLAVRWREAGRRVDAANARAAAALSEDEDEAPACDCCYPTSLGGDADVFHNHERCEHVCCPDWDELD